MERRHWDRTTIIEIKTLVKDLGLSLSRIPPDAEFLASSIPVVAHVGSGPGPRRRADASGLREVRGRRGPNPADAGSHFRDQEEHPIAAAATRGQHELEANISEPHDAGHKEPSEPLWQYRFNGSDTASAGMPWADFVSLINSGLIEAGNVEVRRVDAEPSLTLSLDETKGNPFVPFASVAKRRVSDEVRHDNPLPVASSVASQPATPKQMPTQAAAAVEVQPDHKPIKPNAWSAGGKSFLAVVAPERAKEPADAKKLVLSPPAGPPAAPPKPLTTEQAQTGGGDAATGGKPVAAETGAASAPAPRSEAKSMASKAAPQTASKSKSALPPAPAVTKAVAPSTPASADRGPAPVVPQPTTAPDATLPDSKNTPQPKPAWGKAPAMAAVATPVDFDKVLLEVVTQPPPAQSAGRWATVAGAADASALRSRSSPETAALKPAVVRPESISVASDGSSGAVVAPKRETTAALRQRPMKPERDADEVTRPVEPRTPASAEHVLRTDEVALPIPTPDPERRGETAAPSQPHDAPISTTTAIPATTAPSSQHKANTAVAGESPSPMEVATKVEQPPRSEGKGDQAAERDGRRRGGRKRRGKKEGAHSDDPSAEHDAGQTPLPVKPETHTDGGLAATGPQQETDGNATAKRDRKRQQWQERILEQKAARALKRAKRLELAAASQDATPAVDNAKGGHEQHAAREPPPKSDDGVSHGTRDRNARANRRGAPVEGGLGAEPAAGSAPKGSRIPLPASARRTAAVNNHHSDAVPTAVPQTEASNVPISAEAGSRSRRRGAPAAVAHPALPAPRTLAARISSEEPTHGEGQPSRQPHSDSASALPHNATDAAPSLRPPRRHRRRET